MMKFVVTALLAILVSMPSLAKMTSTERVLLRQKQSVLNTQMRTKSVLVLALPKHQRKFVATSELTDPEDDDLPGPDELDMHVFYRRPIVNKSITFEDEPVSDYVQTRLLMARARALQKHNEKWSNTIAT